MNAAAILALICGSALLSCTVIYLCWTVLRRLRFQVAVLRIRKELIEGARTLNALDDPEVAHTLKCLAVYVNAPYLASLPVFAYLSVVLKNVKTEHPVTDRAELRPLLDKTKKEFVRHQIGTTFLECPTVLLLRLFISLFPKWAQQTLEQDAERSAERSFDNIASSRRNKMQMAGC